MNPAGQAARLVFTALLGIIVWCSCYDCGNAGDETIRNTEGMEMEYWLDFELLKHAKGKAYAMLRNRMLQSEKDVENRLDPYLKSKDWPTAATAMILKGWLHNQEAFGTVLKNLNNENLTRVKESAIGIDVVYKKYRGFAQRYGKDLVPLAWEFLLKQEGEVENWKLIAMTHVIAEASRALSVEILIYFMETTSDETLIDAAASSLTRLLNEQNMDTVKKAGLRHRIIFNELDMAVEEAQAAEDED